jgi:hypothetical protein
MERNEETGLSNKYNKQKNVQAEGYTDGFWMEKR